MVSLWCGILGKGLVNLLQKTFLLLLTLVKYYTIHTGFAESGTDRCALACSNYREAKYTHIVNLQVDYPDISVESLNKLLDISSILDSNVYTLYYKQKPDSKDDVKIALSKKGEALWFSRYASYPYIHVGAYAYNNLLLQKLSRLEQTEESKMESLEQLTWLQHGVKMNAVETQPTISINTKEDYERWLKI
jgi:3-deoxy-manno-octulosonate cytidylyltransferase (CMP-KDO synthetase)